MKIFKMMKGFFGKPAHPPETGDGYSTEMITATEAGHDEAAEVAHSQPPVATIVFDRTPAPAPAPAFVPAPVAARVSTTSRDGSGMLVLPLSSLVSSLPVELQQRVNNEGIGQASITLPLQRVLSQVSQGVVRVTFGEVRKSAPESFSPEEDCDEVPVTLPLGELVKRLGPALMNVKARKQVEIPDEISNPFGARGEGLAIGGGPKVSDTQFARSRGAMPASSLSPTADLRGRSNVTSVRKPEPPGAPATPGTNFFQKKPAAPAPAPAPALVARIVPPAAKPAAPAAPAPLIAFAGLPQPSKPVSKPAVSTGNSNGNGNGFHAPAAPVESKGGEQAAIWVALDVIAETWPDELRLEIAQMNLADAKLALPLEQVEAGLKSGKVSFTWKQVRAAIKPAIAPGISAYDGLQVNVPLSIIAPLFLARQKEINGGQKRVTLDDKIPDLFFGFPQPEAVPAPGAAPGPVAPQPAAKPSDTNYFIWDDDRESAQGQPVLTPPRTGGTPGTTFATRKATPNQVVMKASMLEGVYGALVALPDGLPVACKLDPSQNADTIAALIPQMYSKLSGCTKELRMGELNNLNFTVGNVPWKIFRVNGIFFAAFGCAGEPLPTAQLAELAAELDYKKAQAQ